MVPLRGIKIDPDAHRYEAVYVGPTALPTALGEELKDTIDLPNEHCLVVDGGGPVGEHPSRFRSRDGIMDRPVFGSAHLLGLVNGSLASATTIDERLHKLIIQEVWDQRDEYYGRFNGRPPGRVSRTKRRAMVTSSTE